MSSTEPTREEIAAEMADEELAVVLKDLNLVVFRSLKSGNTEVLSESKEARNVVEMEIIRRSETQRTWTFVFPDRTEKFLAHTAHEAMAQANESGLPDNFFGWDDAGLRRFTAMTGAWD